MEHIEYVKQKDRMCKYYTDRGVCKECPLSRINNEKRLKCFILEIKFPEFAEKAISKWAKEHPVKTYTSQLKEQYPNMGFTIDGQPTFCVKRLGLDSIGCELEWAIQSHSECRKCWEQEVKE